MTITTTIPALNPRACVSRFLSKNAVDLPISQATKQRNIALDRLFYDVESLSKSELDFLVKKTNLEGSILVVHPKGTDRETRVQKYENHTKLRDAPGRLLSRFAIAGVGSSDVGAAALARNLADHYGEPVGAIVAGYGVADVLAEGLGGWFFLGTGNQLIKLFHDREGETDAVLERYQGTIKGLDTTRAGDLASRVTGSPDTDTILRLLLDDDREIKTLLGHSKGCLSIAYALRVLAISGAEAAHEKAKAIRVITTGAVVELPNGFDNAAQFLGSIDWFGGMNSRLDQDHIRVPNAWHHVNTALSFHMSVGDILKRADA